MEDNKGKGGASTYPTRSRVAPIEERIKNPVEFLTELVRDYEHEPEVLVSMIHKHLSHLQYLEGKNLEKIDELEETIDRTVESYSSGQKMKMVFARALVNDAPILMLDEPTNTLDVKEARRLRAIVKEQNEEANKTVIYCTHIILIQLFSVLLSPKYFSISALSKSSFLCLYESSWSLAKC